LNGEIVAHLIAPAVEVLDFGDIPDNEFILAAWNENELLQGSFWFAKEAAYHPTGKLDYTWFSKVAPSSLDIFWPEA
jgi:hypothetical protein